VLPTLADFGKAKIPTEHPSRKLRPVSGISLRPILEAKPLIRKEPIYLQFAKDYGLRDGDWKLVSFKGQQWELYNLATDRAENVDLADKEPKRLQAMVEKWREMSRTVLHSEKLANAVIKPAEVPKSNREWTVFSDSDKPPKNKAKRGKKKKK
jgi:arylsulfatase A-like enzyme